MAATNSETEGTPFTGASSATIDLIGTLSAALMTIVAPFVMAWTKYYGPRPVRGLAMGIISAGTGIGGLVWTPAISACINSLGFRNTLRLTGCVATILICISGFILEWEPSMAKRLSGQNSALSPITAIFKIPVPSKQTVRQRVFFTQAASTLFQSAAYYIPVFFTVTYAKTLGYTEEEGANLTAVSNACNAIGKIAVGFIADRLVLYGLLASAFISLFPAALIELFGVQELPRIAGVMYMLQGLATLVGTPVAGALIRGEGSSRSSSDYTPMSAWAGALMASAAVAVAGVRLEAMKGSGNGTPKRKWKL
uniref:Major facilitator superfamily (MFS) profile domain-containing protein n=1 Tax=Fusarium oxysporum (strain Fo5176) TaxID=660025 RepID=A0A0D2Y1I6_FUSOF